AEYGPTDHVAQLECDIRALLLADRYGVLAQKVRGDRVGRCSGEAHLEAAGRISLEGQVNGHSVRIRRLFHRFGRGFAKEHVLQDVGHRAGECTTNRRLSHKVPPRFAPTLRAEIPAGTAW